MVNLNTIEIFSVYLNSWVVLSLNQFHKLLYTAGLYNDQIEFNLNKLITSGINFRVSEGEEEKDTIKGLIQEAGVSNGEYIEVKHQINLQVSFLSTCENNLQLNIKIVDSSDNVDNLYTVWAREKVILLLSSSNEFLINSKITNTTLKIPSENVRLLNSSNSELFSEYKIKHIDINTTLNFLNLESIQSQEDISINLENIFIELNKKFNPSNLYYSSNFDSINLLGNTTNLLFFTHLMYLKSKEMIQILKLDEKIKLAKEEMLENNRIIEESNKLSFTLPRKFRKAIKNKILDDIVAKDKNVSYLIIDDNDNEIIDGSNIKVLLYGKENLDQFTKIFNLHESSIGVEPKLAQWLNSDKNLDKMNKIVENSKIVNYN